MIEKMKKLTLLIYHSSKDTFLSKLQELGVVHLEINNTVSSENIISSKDRINRLGKAYKILKPYEGHETDHSPRYAINESLEVLLERVERDKTVMDNAFSDCEMYKKEMVNTIPFGSFDHELMNELKNQGVSVKVFITNKKAYSNIDKTNLNCEVIFEDKNIVHYAVFYRDESELVGLHGLEVKLPKFNVNELQEKVDGLNKIIAECEEKLKYSAKFIALIEDAVKEGYNDLHYSFADASLRTEVDGKVLIIKAFVSNKTAKIVEEFLTEQDCAFIIDDPAADEEVPIRLKNNSFAKLFEPIGELFSLPEYHELDTVPFFAPFFALFFGLCLGDFGYGLIILILVAIGLVFVKNKGLRKILYLGLALGLFTVLGGFMLNSFFGTSIVTSEDGVVTANIGIFEQLKGLVTFSNPKDRNGPMIFAILLGVIQVFVGQLLNAYNRVKKLGIQGIFQPIGTNMVLLGCVIMVMVWMYKPSIDNPFTNFVVGPIPLGELIVSIASDPFIAGKYLTFAGIALILLFNSIGSGNFFLRPAKGLWELYNVFTGLLGDILSYIRIFALGLAGGLLGGAFNGIALGLKDVPGGIFFMLIIMIFGHTLNFLLAALGAFVHPLRLTFVEFYKAVGFTGGGKPFTPFTNKNI